MREDRALAAARQIGLNVPKDLLHAEEIVSAVSEVRMGTLPSPPELPSTPTAVFKFLADYGTQCAAIEAAARHTDDFLAIATVRFNAAVRSAAPEWIDALVARFRVQWEAFSASSARLPSDLRPHDVAHLAGENFYAYRSAQDAGRLLSQLLSARLTIGSLFGDVGDLESSFCTVVAVSESGRDVRWPEVMAAIRLWNAEPDSVTRWRALPLSLGTVSLATVGQVSSRLASFASCRDEALAGIGGRR